MSRLIAFVLPLLGALYIWQHWHRPAAWAGLVVLALVLGASWPVALVALIVCVPYSLSLIWPRRMRASYRSGADRGEQRSSRVPKFIQQTVRYADRWSCVFCGRANPDLRQCPLDHRVPWSHGGLSALPNLFTLCTEHNRIKMTYWVDRHGVEHGRTSDVFTARLIWAAERRARWSLLRWWRIAWAFA